jgi:hypothetical protein
LYFQFHILFKSIEIGKEIDMKRILILSIGLVMGIFLISGIFALSANHQALADPPGAIQGNQSALAAQVSSGDSTTEQSAQVDNSDETTPPPPIEGAQSINALPTPIPGETLIYFVPSDNDATATVIYLYNTDTTAHIVALRGFSYNGVLVYSLNINVPATGFIRLGSDSIAAAPPPSWATPAPIITNFTDFTYFASLSLPRGVKAEGYVLFNPGTGVIDPRLDQGAIPLRFSSDPATLFLPLSQK